MSLHLKPLGCSVLGAAEKGSTWLGTDASGDGAIVGSDVGV